MEEQLRDRGRQRQIVEKKIIQSLGIQEEKERGRTLDFIANKRELRDLKADENSGRTLEQDLEVKYFWGKMI